VQDGSVGGGGSGLEAGMATSTVRLTTTQCSSPVSVHLFQFGTVPASPGTFSLLVDSVAPGAGGEAVFWLDRDAAVPVPDSPRR
jgi:hypothetical protein